MSMAEKQHSCHGEGMLDSSGGGSPGGCYEPDDVLICSSGDDGNPFGNDTILEREVMRLRAQELEKAAKAKKALLASGGLN
jgi:hypothetical protein